MTNPADSPTAAKAREQRAREFWQEWLNTQEGGASLFLATSEPGKTLFPFAAAFAESELAATEKRVREECAKTICEHCFKGTELHESKRYHIVAQLNGENWYPDCEAEEIWATRSLEIKGE